MAQITTAPRRRNLPLWSFLLVGAGLLALIPLAGLTLPGKDGSGAVATSGSDARIAYFQFSRQSDTLWLVDPAQPGQRRSSLSVAHAPEYGIVPSLAPDGRRLVYNLLPPRTPIPGPDAPAQLWLAGLQASAEPVLLAQNVDLLVPAVWSDDGGSVVFRRSGGKAEDAYQLVSIPTAGGDETVLVSATDAALFPIGFSAGATSFYFVRLTEDGSYFAAVDLASGAETPLAQLSDGLTRDWSLSPDKTRLAYLSIELGGNEVASSAHLLDLSSGAIATVGAASSEAFSPTWDAGGNLVLGQLATGAASSAAEVIGLDSTSNLTGPARGFDVPLAIDSDGAVAVRSFDGASVTNPGRAVLVVIDQDGTRHQIATGEVTFLGWTQP